MIVGHPPTKAEIGSDPEAGGRQRHTVEEAGVGKLLESGLLRETSLLCGVSGDISIKYIGVGGGHRGIDPKKKRKKKKKKKKKKRRQTHSGPAPCES